MSCKGPLDKLGGLWYEPRSYKLQATPIAGQGLAQGVHSGLGGALEDLRSRQTSWEVLDR